METRTFKVSRDYEEDERHHGEQQLLHFEQSATRCHPKFHNLYNILCETIKDDVGRRFRLRLNRLHFVKVHYRMYRMKMLSVN